MNLALLALAAPVFLAGALLPGTARASGFAPGEETVFGVSYLNLPTGEARIRVGQPEGAIWPVIFQARTDGVAGLVDIREHLVSYWDADTGLPRGSDLRAYEVGDYHVDSARFDRASGEATVVVQRKGQRSVKTFPIAPDVRDLTSAFMWLRLQELAVGRRYEVPVCSGSKQFMLLAEVVGREAVSTPAGRFPSFKVKVRTELEGKFTTRRDSFLWLSEDERHVLVRASADFAVGSVVATLRSYRPGNAVASR
jgi:hypothetical protein